MQHISPKNRNQIDFLSLEDLVESDNSVRFVDAFVDKLELEKLGSMRMDILFFIGYNIDDELPW